MQKNENKQKHKCPSMDELIKQTLVCSLNGILQLGNKKEWTIDTYDNTDKSSCVEPKEP